MPWIVPSGGGSGAPSGPAGGSLTGDYPDPGIADLAVSTTQLADTSVTTAKLANGSVDSAALADNAVDTGAIQNSAVTLGKLALPFSTWSLGTVAAPPAPTGTLRLPNGAANGNVSGITFRDAVGTGEVTGLAIDGSNYIYIGQNLASTYQAGGVAIASTSQTLIRSGASQYVFGQNAVTLSGYVEFKPTAAGQTAVSGDMRFAENRTIAASRNHANGSDIGLIALNASDDAFFGGSASLHPNNTYLDAEVSVQLRVLGTTAFKIDNAGTKVGFFNHATAGQQSAPAAATDLPTAIALVNALRTGLINLGLFT